MQKAAINESTIKAIWVDDCEALQADFLKETLQSVVKVPVMNKFDHGAQIACVSSLIGFLRQ